MNAQDYCDICDEDLSAMPAEVALLVEGVCVRCWLASVVDGVHTRDEIPAGLRPLIKRGEEATMSTATTNMVMLSREDPGWARVWDVVAARCHGDRVCEDPDSGEVWQYMGTVIVGEGGRHEFRHRALPPRRERAYFSCPVMPGDFLPREYPRATLTLVGAR